MKQLFVILLISTLSAAVANGQVMQMEYGVSGGLNIASNNCVLETGGEGSVDFAYGFVGNVFVDHHLLPTLAARFGVGVVMGGSDTRMPMNGVTTSFETRTIYLDFPILAKYNVFGFGHHFVYALGGINVGYLLSAKVNGVSIMKDLRKFDMGLLGGVGISMPVASHIIFVEAQYGYGLLNTSDLEGEELKNRGIRLTAGITL